MKTEFLNPEQTLQDFFMLDKAFAFHDQTAQPDQFSYGRSIPEVVVDSSGSDVSALHLITSPGGGLATFIAPALPVDETALEDYIRQNFVPEPGQISLVQEDIQQALFLRFIHQPVSASYDVAFDQSKMPLTHDEATQLVGAIQGGENQVYLITQSQFSVSSRVNAKLETDWIAFLTLAFTEQAREPAAITRLLNQQIDAGIIVLHQQVENTPSAQTQEQVKNALINLAASLVSATLRNVSSLDELPTEVSYDVSYSNSVPQQYRLEHALDIASLLSRFPFSSIVTFDSSPLPEPKRPDKPVEHHECIIKLGFEAKDFKVLSMELSWADKKVSMTWPDFPSVTLTAESEVIEITLKVGFSDYSTYEKKLLWQDAITLSPQDLGYYSVLFEASHLSSYFKSISGNAEYVPAGHARKQTFHFSFPAQKAWQANWWINAHSDALDSRIEYRWQGETSSFFSKHYDSGSQQAAVSPITLQYNK
ncbi:hypothetical protein PCO82_10575 [Pectobacteriaceae bacterium CE90]|nr:hypothetical protein PCO82_10575 [Pectobacteriaceae bacterium CE90]